MKLKLNRFLLWPICLGVILSAALAAVADSPVVEEKTTASFVRFDEGAKAGLPRTVVFFGGSLAAGEGASDRNATSYRALLEAHLKQTYPNAKFSFIDASLPNTGSKMAMFRLDRDVLIHRPDLVFMDFTVEDKLSGTARQELASYERILREVINDGVPVVLVLNGSKDFAGPDWKHLGPPRLRDHLELARLYHTGVANSLSLAQTFLLNNQARTRDQIWIGDGGAMTDQGHRFVYIAARTALETAIQDKRICYVPRESVFASEYKNIFEFLPGTVPLPVGWQTAPSMAKASGLTTEVALCNGNNADTKPLQLNFNGSFLGIFGETASNGLGYKIVVDGKTIPYAATPRDDVWPTRTAANDEKKLFWHEAPHAFSPGRHTVEIIPIRSLGTPGELRIQSICVAGMDPEPGPSASLAR